jgi:hypothetical protein
VAATIIANPIANNTIGDAPNLLLRMAVGLDTDSGFESVEAFRQTQQHLHLTALHSFSTWVAVLSTLPLYC